MSASNQEQKILFTFGILILMSCFLSVFGDASASNEEEDEDTGREMREYMPEAWHAVHTIPEGSNGWIPRDPEDSQGVVSTKRRRLRKRKRRPPIVSYLDQSVENVASVKHDFHEQTHPATENVSLPLTNTRYDSDESKYTEPKRKKRPNTGDPWEELQEESVRPYIRRKVTPAYQTSDDPAVITKSDSSYSPLSATIQFGPEQTSNSESQQNPPSHYGSQMVQKEDRVDTEREDISFVPASTTTKKTPNLKEILKQNGGLSLSEILQHKNITLSELLMGNQEAIKALTETSDKAPSTPHSTYSENTITFTPQKSTNVGNSETTKYKRLPPSVALRKEAINRRYEQYAGSYDSLSDKELMEAQKKRLALLQGHNYKGAQNGKFSDVTRYEVVTEPITEKRIFVPSHPKLYTSVDYKPDFEDVISNTEPYLKSETPTGTTTHRPTTTTQKSEPTIKYTQTSKAPKLGFTKAKASLPITSAKLMKITTKKLTTPIKVLSTMETFVTEEENYPKMTGLLLKPFKISIKDILGLQSPENQPEEKVQDGPLRMSIDLDTILDNSTPKTSLEYFSITTPISSTTLSAPPTPTTEIPKLKPYTAKEEILEILKDPLGRAELARILEARNMTVQELIDQRERGSSQLHLADIFHNKTKEPEPTEEALEGRISSEVFTSFPVFVRQPKVLLNHETTSQRPVESTSQDSKLSITAFPSYKIEVNKDLGETKEAFPWQQLYPDLFNVQDQNQNEKPVTTPRIQHVLDQGPLVVEPADILTEEDIQRLEDDLDQRLYSAASNEHLNIVDETPQKILNVSSGVKSAIIASLAIVLLSMIVFVTILVVFKWTQRRKKRLNYGDSLKPPLFDVKPRNIKTFMAETLGKKKVNYYKRHLQSMSDDIWEREKERNNVF